MPYAMMFAQSLCCESANNDITVAALKSVRALSIRFAQDSPLRISGFPHFNEITGGSFSIGKSRYRSFITIPGGRETLPGRPSNAASSIIGVPIAYQLTATYLPEYAVTHRIRCCSHIPRASRAHHRSRMRIQGVSEIKHSSTKCMGIVIVARFRGTSPR
jgi:hypothetical protein